MSAAVAERAIGRAFVAAFFGEAVGAESVVACLIAVAGYAGGFIDVGGMGVLVVLFVAGIAG